MNGRYRSFALAWLMSVSVSCTSSPVRYYTLTPPPDTGLLVAEPAFQIDVRVHTPPQLNRSELMIRTGPTELSLLENERWASPLNSEIKEALELGLRRRLRRTPEMRLDLTRLTLDIDVRQFEAEPGRHVQFEASWKAVSSVAGGPSSAAARATTCSFQADQNIGADYPGIVAGYQREIAALADAIAMVLTSRANDFDRPCR